MPTLGAVASSFRFSGQFLDIAEDIDTIRTTNRIYLRNASGENQWSFGMDSSRNWTLRNELRNEDTISSDIDSRKVTIFDLSGGGGTGATTLNALTDVSGVTQPSDFGKLMYYDYYNQKYVFTGDLRYNVNNWLLSTPLVYDNSDIQIYHDIGNTNNIFIGGSARTNPEVNGSIIGIGYQTCDASNHPYNIAIGHQAGRLNQGNNQGSGSPFEGEAIAIGHGAGESGQKAHSISIGTNAGRNNQKESAIACGYGSGSNNQGNYALALGNGAGQSSQQDFALALGTSSGAFSQGTNSVAIGTSAGYSGLGNESVAIGLNASYNGSNYENTIVINGTGLKLNPQHENSTYIKPIREQLNNDFLFYDSISGEVTRSVAVNFTSNIFINGDRGNENDVLTSQGTLGTPIWRAPSTAPKIAYYQILSNQDISNLAWKPMPYSNAFIYNTIGTDVSMDTNSVVTIATGGIYKIEIKTRIYNSSSQGLRGNNRIRLNGTSTLSTTDHQLGSANINSLTITDFVVYNFADGDTFQVEVFFWTNSVSTLQVLPLSWLLITKLF